MVTKLFASRSPLGIALVALVATAALKNALAVPPPIAEERLTLTKLPAVSPHWIWVFDDSINNGIDLRMHLFDGDSHKRLGQVDMGFFGTPGFSPDGKTLAAASTYFSHGSHGTRTDVIEFTDTTTLNIVRELNLPPKRMNSMPTYFSLPFSSDGHWLYVPFLTPASSIGLVDVQKNALIGELDTAGCVVAIPGGPNRVSSICENGTLQTLTLDADGHEISRSVSDAFFDVDKDPVFVQGVPGKGHVTFLSFDGLVYDADFTDSKASVKAPWSLVTPLEKGKWRPGGMQIAAINQTLRRLYVPMHIGGQEMHKEGGTQIWVFDMDTHQRLARWPLGSPKLKPVISVQVSQDDKPLLFAISGESDVVIYDGLTGKLKHIEHQLGQTPWMMFNP